MAPINRNQCVEGKLGTYFYESEQVMGTAHDDFYDHDYWVGSGSYNIEVYEIRDGQPGRKIGSFRRPIERAGVPAVFVRGWVEEFVKDYEAKSFPNEGEELQGLEALIGARVVVKESWDNTINTYIPDKGWQHRTSLEPKETKEGVLVTIDKLGICLRIDSERKYIAFSGSGSWSGDEPGSGGGGHYEDCWTYSRITEIRLAETGKIIYLAR